jgi:hypothetical protein
MKKRIINVFIIIIALVFVPHLVALGLIKMGIVSQHEGLILKWSYGFCCTLLLWFLGLIVIAILYRVFEYIKYGT